MHVVVNHLPIRPDADWSEIAAKFDAFAAGLRPQFPSVHSALVTRAGPAEAIVIVIYHDKETMDHVSSKVAAPWFAENIRPYLAAPVARSTSEVIAGFVG